MVVLITKRVKGRDALDVMYAAWKPKFIQKPGRIARWFLSIGMTIIKMEG